MQPSKQGKSLKDDNKQKRPSTEGADYSRRALGWGTSRWGTDTVDAEIVSLQPTTPAVQAEVQKPGSISPQTASSLEGLDTVSAVSSLLTTRQVAYSAEDLSKLLSPNTSTTSRWGTSRWGDELTPSAPSTEPADNTSQGFNLTSYENKVHLQQTLSSLATKEELVELFKGNLFLPKEIITDLLLEKNPSLSPNDEDNVSQTNLPVSSGSENGSATILSPPNELTDETTKQNHNAILADTLKEEQVPEINAGAQSSDLKISELDSKPVETSKNVSFNLEPSNIPSDTSLEKQSSEPLSDVFTEDPSLADTFGEIDDNTVNAPVSLSYSGLENVELFIDSTKEVGTDDNVSLATSFIIENVPLPTVCSTTTGIPEKESIPGLESFITSPISNKGLLASDKSLNEPTTNFFVPCEDSCDLDKDKLSISELKDVTCISPAKPAPQEPCEDNCELLDVDYTTLIASEPTAELLSLHEVVPPVTLSETTPDNLNVTIGGLIHREGDLVSSSAVKPSVSNNKQCHFISCDENCTLQKEEHASLLAKFEEDFPSSNHSLIKASVSQDNTFPTQMVSSLRAFDNLMLQKHVSFPKLVKTSTDGSVKPFVNIQEKHLLDSAKPNDLLRPNVEAPEVSTNYPMQINSSLFRKHGSTIPIEERPDFTQKWPTQCLTIQRPVEPSATDASGKSCSPKKETDKIVLHVELPTDYFLKSNAYCNSVEYKSSTSEETLVHLDSIKRVHLFQHEAPVATCVEALHNQSKDIPRIQSYNTSCEELFDNHASSTQESPDHVHTDGSTLANHFEIYSCVNEEPDKTNVTLLNDLEEVFDTLAYGIESRSNIPQSFDQGLDSAEFCQENLDTLTDSFDRRLNKGLHEKIVTAQEELDNLEDTCETLSPNVDDALDIGGKLGFAIRKEERLHEPQLLRYHFPSDQQQSELYLTQNNHNVLSARNTIHTTMSQSSKQVDDPSSSNDEILKQNSLKVEEERSKSKNKTQDLLRGWHEKSKTPMKSNNERFDILKDWHDVMKPNKEIPGKVTNKGAITISPPSKSDLLQNWHNSNKNESFAISKEKRTRESTRNATLEANNPGKTRQEAELNTEPVAARNTSEPINASRLVAVRETLQPVAVRETIQPMTRTAPSRTADVGTSKSVTFETKQAEEKTAEARAAKARAAEARAARARAAEARAAEARAAEARAAEAKATEARAAEARAAKARAAEARAAQSRAAKEKTAEVCVCAERAKARVTEATAAEEKTAETRVCAAKAKVRAAEARAAKARAAEARAAEARAAEARAAEARAAEARAAEARAAEERAAEARADAIRAAEATAAGLPILPALDPRWNAINVTVCSALVMTFLMYHVMTRTSW